MYAKLNTTIVALLLTLSAVAQSPAKISYQAVIRNTSNVLLNNQQVGIQISVLQGSIAGTSVYTETHTVSTNANGLVSIEIGSGAIVSGNLNTIDWSNGAYFIKTETDPAGGSNYTISGTSQLLSVPYSLHANIADSIAGGVTVTETDPVFASSIAGSIVAADTSRWNNPIDTKLDSTGVAALGFVAGPHTVEVDGSITNEIQALSISNDTVFLSDGGFVKLPATFDGNYSSLTGAPTVVSAFTNDVNYLTTEIDGSVTNEIELPTGGSNGQVLQTDGSGNYTWTAQTADTDTQLSEAQVDGFVANNGYLTTEVDGSVTNEIQALSISNDTVYLSDGGFVKLPASFNGDFTNLTNVPSGLADGDDNTQLSETQVDGFVANNGYLTTEVDGSVTNEIQALSISNDTVYLSGGGFVKLPASFNGDFTNLTNVPSGLADGDDNTQLSETQVDGFVANNGYLTTEVDGSVTNEIQALSISNDTVYLSDGGFVKLPASFNGDFTNLTNVPSGLADGDDNTQLSETQVDGFVANNGYLTTEIDGSVTNEIELPTGGSNGQVLQTDGSGNYTWVNQTQIPATLTYLGMLRCGLSTVGTSSNTQIPSGVNTSVKWLSVSQDYNSSLGGTDNTVITIPTGVTKIRIITTIIYSSPSPNAKSTFVVNYDGSVFTLSNRNYGTYQFFNSEYGFNYSSTLIDVIPGKSFEIQLRQNSGSTYNLSWGSVGTRLAVEYYSN